MWRSALSFYQKKKNYSGTAYVINRLSYVARPSRVKTSTYPHTLNPVDSPPTDHRWQHQRSITIPAHVFGKNVRSPDVKFKLPEVDGRLSSTPQLAYCLELRNIHSSADKYLEPTVPKWLQQTEKDTDERERLHIMPTEVIRAFKRDEIKDAKVVAEVVSLAPVLDKDAFQDQLSGFYSGFDHCRLLDFHQLEGLAQLIQGADTGYLSSHDLVKILELLSNCLKDTHQQSTQHMHELTLAVSNVLDAMADTKVTDLKRETLHEPLSKYLGELKKSSDPYLAYQAAHACQALQYVPENETKWQTAMQRTGKVAKEVSGLISSAKGFDINKFIESLVEIQKRLEGASKNVHKLNSAHKDVSKPEHDMIAGQLRIAEFSEEQIRQMKHYLKFVLICDGYKSQQTQKLYSDSITFLKFAEAIYKEQGGHPVVEYSQFVDAKSLKAEFFDHDGRKFLREACPLTRNGSQHRFIHRSLLEYGLARAVFDAQGRRTRASSGLAVGRRRSVSSTLSIESQDCFDQMAEANEPEPDVVSPLVWRTIMKDHSLLQFLAERVQQEPLFKQRLFAYIEHSKMDKKLLKQLGAVGERETLLNETSKKVATTAPVVTNFEEVIFQEIENQSERPDDDEPFDSPGETFSTPKTSRKATKTISRRSITGAIAGQDAKPTREQLESEDTRQSFEEWGDASSNDASVEAPAEFNQAQDPPPSPPPETGDDDDGKRRDTVTETSGMVFSSPSFP